MANLEIDPKIYVKTLAEIKARVYKARSQAFHAVNKELINLYWDIGKIIVERQKKEGWGMAVVEKLALELQLEFPGITGFSARNIWRMRNLYLLYEGKIILSTLSSEIGWWHNITIIIKCKNDQQREFYMRMTKMQGWSVRTLKEKIRNKEFEHWLLGQSNFTNTLPKDLTSKGELLLKDEYNLDFLGIEDEVSEREFESKLMQKIDRFIKEIGGNIMFAGRQIKFEIGEDEFFIDLLFYHKNLRSYIVIELKVDKFKPEYAGKMAFYLGLVEEKLIDNKHDNPSIGIILCREKNSKLVEASLRFIARPIGIATYRTYKDTRELPKNISKFLPTNQEITEKLLALVEA